MRINYAIVFVTDMKRSTAFYRDVIDEFHQRMLQNKVPCIQEPKETFGTRIAQYADPDGLAISVSEERRGK
jgi:catechol 2,3-dioxygenase-like lactoylglutathione lyase family enzyme